LPLLQNKTPSLWQSRYCHFVPSTYRAPSYPQTLLLRTSDDCKNLNLNASILIFLALFSRFATAPLVTGALTWTTKPLELLYNTHLAYHVSFDARIPSLPPVAVSPLMLYASSLLLHNRSSRCRLRCGANLLTTKTSQSPGCQRKLTLCASIFRAEGDQPLKCKERYTRGQSIRGDHLSLPRLCVWHKKHRSDPRPRSDSKGMVPVPRYLHCDRLIVLLTELWAHIYVD